MGSSWEADTECGGLTKQLSIYQDLYFLLMAVPDQLILQFQCLDSLLRGVGENPSESEVQDMMIEVDASSTGTFQFPNFLALMAWKIDENNVEGEIRESFSVFDTEGLGMIHRKKLSQVLDNLGMTLDKDEIELLLDEIDVDGDGQINYEEFYTMMCTK